jgi:predicted lipase
MIPLRKLFVLTVQLVSGLYRLFDHPTEIQHYFEENNITNGQILLNSRGEIIGSIGSLPDEMLSVISFRGSETIVDWVHDLEIKQSDYYIGKVLSGFLLEYQAVRSQIEQHLKFCRRTDGLVTPSGVKYIISGHSLGAALAILCAVNIYIEFGIHPIVYLYSSPRVGNIEFSNWYDQHIPNTYMFYLAGDFVPNFPTVNMGCYKHVAHPHYILNYDPVQRGCSLHAYHSMDNFLITDEWFKHTHRKCH